jgi:hypothetical protein
MVMSGRRARYGYTQTDIGKVTLEEKKEKPDGVEVTKLKL